MTTEDVKAEREAAVVPVARREAPAEERLSDRAFQAYLIEYEQCLESYRHTYQTIWQSSAVFSAIAAGILAFADNLPHADLIAPLPIIFWFLGIFRPMNRYGELRSDRLADLEHLLSDATPGLDMRHVRGFNVSRKSRRAQRLRRFEWLWRPRVTEVVTAFSLALVGLEIYLIYRALR